MMSRHQFARVLLVATVPLLLSGCLSLPFKSAAKPRPATTLAKPVKAEKPVLAATDIDPDCYTVDLFTPEEVQKPEKDVPEAYRAYLGRWSGGAWNDVWCHNLLVYNVHKDGSVDLVEMHAPYEPWGQPATAFNRVARIGEDGKLRFSQGVERTTYRLENGFLVGTRSGLYGDLKITLYQDGPPPLPQPRPVRLAQARSVKSGG